MNEKTEYPKWLYRAGGDSKLVTTAEAHDRLGAWWFESPGEASDAVAIAVAEARGELPVKERHPLESPTDGVLNAYYAAPVKIAAARAQALATIEDLDELRDVEEQRPGGARKGVLKAIGDRMQELIPVTHEVMEVE